jgi:hypothetical protein
VGAVYLAVLISAAITAAVFFGLRKCLRRYSANRISLWFAHHRQNKSEIVIFTCLYLPIFWCVWQAMGQN